MASITLMWRNSAAAVCYTLDGQGADEIDVETFSADVAVLTIHGVNIHPGVAKGRMTNAVRVAASLLDRLPRTRLSPETTEGREGYLHPYEISGGVAEVRARILFRDFDAPALDRLAELLRQAVATTQAEFPGTRSTWQSITIRNMAEGLASEPPRRLQRGTRPASTGAECETNDCSRRNRWLPSDRTRPALAQPFHRGARPHSPLEWTCLEEMVQAVQWLVKLSEVWTE